MPLRADHEATTVGAGGRTETTQFRPLLFAW
jgi:hypothetical protein